MLINKTFEKMFEKIKKFFKKLLTKNKIEYKICSTKANKNLQNKNSKWR